MNITAAQKAKAEKTLSRLVRSEFGVTTRAEFIERHKRMGATVSEGEKPKVQWCRHKFNKMDYREQIEYERKMEERVPCYKLHTNSEGDEHPLTYIEITKTEYDYFLSL